MSMDFINELMEKMTEQPPDFGVRGFLVGTNRIYPIGTDTKVLSTVFELVVKPLILEVAEENGLVVHEPPAQNFYPDFTLLRDHADKEKIAVDVKSTYRNFKPDGNWTAGFTLGSYTSFLRNETKNIAFPLSDYARHFIVGFIYTREVIEGSQHYFELADAAKVPCPISDVEFFAQEKYRIAGESAGSGNTTNIGSILGFSVSDFADGDGPFAKLGEDVFEDYWRNYGRTKSERSYSNISEYRRWRSSMRRAQTRRRKR